VINPRAHGQGDYLTPECEMPAAPPRGWWELCEIWAPSCGWGYSDRHPGSSHRAYLTVGWLLSRLARVRSWGGNYLIDCGPMADGRMPATYYRRMTELAAWMRHSGEAMLGTQAGPYPEAGTVPITVRGDAWYLHVLPGHDRPIRVRGVERPPHSVRLLRTGEPVRWRLRRGVLTLEPTIYVWTGLDDVFVVRWSG
jgi:alpha-L-fucosidase